MNNFCSMPITLGLFFRTNSLFIFKSECDCLDPELDEPE